MVSWMPYLIACLHCRRSQIRRVLVRRPHRRVRAGQAARATFAVPARIAAFPVVPRRRGGRPARGVGVDGAHRLSRPAGRSTRHRDALPGRRGAGRHARARGDILDCDDDAVAYGGQRASTGDGSIELVDCLGPMLPVAEFDAPDALRERFALLRGAGAAPERFAASTLAANVTDRAPASRVRASSRFRRQRPSSTITFRAGRCFRRRCCSTRRCV